MAYVKKGHHRRRVLCPCTRRDMDYTATRCCLCASDARRDYWQRRHAIAKGFIVDDGTPDLPARLIDRLAERNHITKYRPAFAWLRQREAA